ncbi:cell-death-related nuclease 7 [Adelges cooleyi]|uniref:cell-death-related nuclease 7 n=1 Tax=Adelges cooleyi TaxID=133065 RepID=UPI00217FF8CD|nr:cell-death-related nuclease 7 [Adelges cooleyi]
MKFVFYISIALTAVVAFGDKLQCKNPSGQPVDWFVAIKLPKLQGNFSDGTGYIYMDSQNKTPSWSYHQAVTIENSAMGHSVSQIYVSSESQNDTLMWLVYNDEPTNGPVQMTLGHTKGMVAADKDSGYWLVHSVPKYPQLPYQNNNSYTYPPTGVKFGQSFLCLSMLSQELDKVGDQIINNEAKVYGSHFGKNLQDIYPKLYNATQPHDVPSSDIDPVRLQHLQTIKGFKVLSIAKNRQFGKDLYEDLVTNLAQSDLYTETWLNSRDRFNSSCSNKFKTMNIKSIVMKGVKLRYKSSKDHSKWATSVNNSIPLTCIGDVNRAGDQTRRGGGTVCIDSLIIWNEFRKLVDNIEKCNN